MTRDEHTGRVLEAENDGRWELVGPPVRFETTFCSRDGRPVRRRRPVLEQLGNRLRKPRFILLALAFSLSATGCAVNRDWKCKRCYEGPARAFSDISVVLVASGGNPVPRIRSIEGKRVPDCVEYHLMPGTHTIVAGSRRGRTTDIPLTCTLRAGFVYKLTADIWNVKQETDYYIRGMSVECDWRPRLAKLGTFEELTSDTRVSPYVFRCRRARTLSSAGVALASGAPAGDVDPDKIAHFSDRGLPMSLYALSPLLMIAFSSTTMEDPPSHWGIVPDVQPAGEWDEKDREFWRQVFRGP